MRGDLLHRVLRGRGRSTPASSRRSLCLPADERFDLAEDPRCHQARISINFSSAPVWRQTICHGSMIAVVLHRWTSRTSSPALTCAQPVAVGHEVQPLGRVAGKDDLARSDFAPMKACARRLARLLITYRSPRRSADTGRAGGSRCDSGRNPATASSTHCGRWAVAALSI